MTSAAGGEAPVAPVLRAVEVTKVYGGTHALKGVSLDIAPGRVTVLFGENGAGKSTLMKILSAVESPTTGLIELDDRVVRFGSARDAADSGISIIHQELSLCANLSIQDNLFLGRERTRRGILVDAAAQRDLARKVLQRLDGTIDAATPVGELRLGQQQLVEIARALLQNARVLIMDEPTSALSAPEVDVLFKVIRELTAQGVAVVYISHHLEEALEIADDVAVLRDGSMVATARAEDVDLAWVVRTMVGREQDGLFPSRETDAGAVALETVELSVADPANPDRLAVDSISLSVRAGETVGIYGLMGSGRTELLECLAGRIPVAAGKVYLHGSPVTGSVRSRIRAGLALVPEDRQRDGLVQTMSVGQNLSLAALSGFVRRLVVDRGAERSAVASMIGDVTVKTSGPEAPIGSLSGGNQQKVVIGKMLMTGPRVLLLDEPSRGVDVGAKADVFALMARQAERGLAVLFTTSEAEEALHIPDRLLVLVRGRLVADLRAGEVTRDRLMSLADGAESTEKAHDD
ncbi:sugar ABC transporter ATP-binding protein [Actinacidiphila bryophytorum]|uniref:Ribose import ATP-binding protein RbsA n=1 Tax=Actinacidiphila bryophytorum TaxID=1436133 RepID=A0A9W4E3L2_9ACTN|nr:sugar ABC transporter ATP-binding protein [Actinacidiphila bryophytorum]MBM9438379.1 sugar ABC transporter ATP-binding protein [Actinacidiphila bryophytorum]MBN6547006.1 sugar ABC transporter ATP-binding protein [Actinacidiphila bryophytorum]CAG7614342.1 Ribose import ATP-binding protein RbsA [Actinacidiphila bryophytorum]